VEFEFTGLQRGLTYKLKVSVYQTSNTSNLVESVFTSFKDGDKDVAIKAGDLIQVKRLELKGTGLTTNKEAIRGAMQKLFSGFLAIFATDTVEKIAAARPSECRANRATNDFVEQTQATTTRRILQDTTATSDNLTVALVPDPEATTAPVEITTEKLTGVTPAKINENITGTPLEITFTATVVTDDVYASTEFTQTDFAYANDNATFKIKGPKDNLLCQWAIKDYTTDDQKNNNWFNANDCTDELKTAKRCGVLAVTTTATSVTINGPKLTPGNYSVDAVCMNNVHLATSKSLFMINTFKVADTSTTSSQTTSTTSTTTTEPSTSVEGLKMFNLVALLSFALFMLF
jgi:hypothetical protein